MRIEKSVIADKLAKLKGIIPPKPAIECMKGILVDGNRLVAYNLDSGMSTLLEESFEEKFILPLKAIEMIESLPDGLVDISIQPNNTVSIQTGGISNKFQSFNPADYPDVPEFDPDEKLDIEIDGLQEHINSVLYAVATVDTKPVHTGVLMECDKGYLNLVACDGYRMAWAKVKHTGKFKMVVPRLAVQKLLQLGIKDKVSISYNSHTVIFTLEEYSLYTRLLTGDFVDYKKTFPKTDNSAIFDRKALVNSVTRAVICTDDKAKTDPIVMEISDDNLRVSIKSALGEYAEEIMLDSKIDEPIKIGFNARYLLECLRSYKSDNVECRFGGSTTPMTVGDGDLLSLVLPVRLK